ncbi:(2Fe-2S)-binding protein [Nitratireductor thuwali]|uniref:Hydrogen cyanide synthase subunit HcnA n=1 Tax=Nitratireductor thuwali TaxID=2267699 RepID=A0ABY5MSU3_9HYPH|nr:Hydrogen cyanide synthase subunit HcnA [Nitratireductor thuwali]
MAVFEFVSHAGFTAASQKARVTITVDGELVQTAECTRIAAVLLSLDEHAFRRSPISDAPRSAYCMMGICFECLVEIDGRPNRQACLAFAQDGMEVRRGLDSQAQAER